NTNEDSALFSKYNTLIVKDLFSNRVGPLGGLHASLHWINSKKNIDWLISVPADTPFLPDNLVEQLFKATIDKKHKIVLAKSNGKTHPIIGIWHSSLLSSLENDINLGTRKILRWAENYSMGYVEFSNNQYDYFFNINYKEDILKAEEIENKQVEII
ncbi:MAG: Molybdenum cofactor guanylyltransferase, partial [Alphaproteobacteria bacterium MarineAlpha5_Bin6]